MELKIYAKNIDLNPHAESYIHKKFGRLERHLKPLSDAKLEITRTSDRSQADRVSAQITLSTNRYTLRGERRGSNLFAAIDAVTDVIDRQIRRYKGKVYRSEQARRAAKTDRDWVPDAVESLDDGAYDEAEVERPRVVRTKRFSMTPMTVEDAITEMEMVGHSFFLFFNVDSSEHNVVYRRQDGDYGVIEPDLQ